MSSRARLGARRKTRSGAPSDLAGGEHRRFNAHDADVQNALAGDFRNVYAAEFVAIFYLDEDAHSPIWFFLLLTMMPALSAIFGAIATCTPCKWDDMFVAIATAVLMNVTFAYFCSGSAGVGSGTRTSTYSAEWLGSEPL